MWPLASGHLPVLSVEFGHRPVLSVSEELPSVAVGQDDQEEEGGDCRDQEERPEEPPVDRLRQHLPLSPDEVVPRLRMTVGTLPRIKMTRTRTMMMVT